MRLFETESRGERRAVIGLLVSGLLLRLAFAAAAFGGQYDPHVRLKGDTVKYLAIGISLSRGEGFSLHYREFLPQVFQGQPVTPPPAAPTAARSPGYPLFLAVAFAGLGYHLRAVVVLQAILSSLTPLFVYLTAREIKAAPLLALTFAVFYYPFAFDPIYLMSEWIFTLCTAASLWLLVRPGNELVSGVVSGIAILVKSVTLPFLLLAALIPGRRGWMFLTGLACVVGPWGFRNYLHTGVPYVTLSCAGYPLFLLHNPDNREFPLLSRPGDLNEEYPGFQRATARIRSQAPRSADTVAQEYLEDGQLFLEAVRFVRSDPEQAARSVWRSLANTWRLDYPTANPVRFVSNLTLYAGLLPFVLWGSLGALRRGPIGGRLLALFLLYFVAVHSLLASEIRYRIAAMPAYFVMAAAGLSDIRGIRRMGGRPATDPDATAG